MNKIFKQEINTLSFTRKEKEELGNLKFYAIDNHITAERNFQDDYIAFYKEWCILVTYYTGCTRDKALLKYMYNSRNSFELEFEPSGDVDIIKNDDDYMELYNIGRDTQTPVVYMININNPKRVYRADSHIFSDYLKNANSFLEQQEVLAEFKQNSIYIDKILESMNTTTFVQGGDFKVETDINKLVRFANSNLNKYVRNKVDNHLRNLELFNKVEFLIGASSPKRNLLHNIVNTFNDLDVLTHYLIAKENELEKYTNETNETRDRENISMFKQFMKEHPITLNAYNYYDNELYVKCNGVHVTLTTEGFSWYDNYDRYDDINKSDLYQHTNIKNI